jgi:hypothetical protein
VPLTATATISTTVSVIAVIAVITVPAPLGQGHRGHCKRDRRREQSGRKESGPHHENLHATRQSLLESKGMLRSLRRSIKHEASQTGGVSQRVDADRSNLCVGGARQRQECDGKPRRRNGRGRDRTLAQRRWRPAGARTTPGGRDARRRPAPVEPPSPGRTIRCRSIVHPAPPRPRVPVTPTRALASPSCVHRMRLSRIETRARESPPPAP